MTVHSPANCQVGGVEFDGGGDMGTVAEAPSKRIHTATSRTAEWTCMSRAASSFETEPHYHSDDAIAAKLAPGWVQALLHTRVGRGIFHLCLAQKGMYEYVIARTKYIDAAYEDALEGSFNQIVIFGAGFDSRALRFNTTMERTRVFELDAPVTQKAKIERYRECGFTVPSNLTFVAVDFEKDSVPDRLAEAGVVAGHRSLFILEGVLMYLEAEAVEGTFQLLEYLGGHGSRVVFDYVRGTVIRGEGGLYGELGAARAVAGVKENWTFGIDPKEVEGFVAKYGFRLLEHLDAHDLERLYFTDSDGKVVARVNETHGIVMGERR